MYMKRDFSHRFGFVLTEAGRLYSRRFDHVARDALTLSRAQCRALAALASAPDGAALTQIDLADQLDVTAMAVGSLCDRLCAAGLIRRQAVAEDRRVNQLVLEPGAHAALDAAMLLGDQIETEVLAGFSAAERKQLMDMLRRIHQNLLKLK